MRYVAYIFSGLLMLWMLYLCRRSIMPRLPGQLGVYRRAGLGAVVAASLMNAVLVGFAIAAAEEAWQMSAVLLAAAAMYAWLLSRYGMLVVVFSEEELAVRGLFGSVQMYRWEDVSAYTVQREETRGRFSHTYDMYRLTLPDRVLAISNAEDAGRALLQVFERRRPDMNAVRQAEQGNDKNKAVC